MKTRYHIAKNVHHEYDVFLVDNRGLFEYVDTYPTYGEAMNSTEVERWVEPEACETLEAIIKRIEEEERRLLSK